MWPMAASNRSRSAKRASLNRRVGRRVGRLKFFGALRQLAGSDAQFDAQPLVVQGMSQLSDEVTHQPRLARPQATTGRHCDQHRTEWCAVAGGDPRSRTLL
jgi:hypothetical protein